MKHALYFPLLLALAFFGWTSPPEGALVAHYSFDECDASDRFGLSNGITFGNPDCGCGVVGSAMYFDGMDDYVRFEGRVNDAFGANDFTVSFYFKTYAEVTRQILLSNRSECDMVDPFIELKHLQPCGGSGTGRIYSEVSQDQSKRAIGVGLLPESRWRHVTFVRSGDEIITYMNGEEVDKRKSHKGLADLTGSGPLHIAFSPCINASRGEEKARYFPLIGAMDELRVYNKALSSEQILILYNDAPVDSAEVDCAS